MSRQDGGLPAAGGRQRGRNAASELHSTAAFVTVQGPALHHAARARPTRVDGLFDVFLALAVLSPPFIGITHQDLCQESLPVHLVGALHLQP